MAYRRCNIPETSKLWPYDGLMLGQRLRCWASINQHRVNVPFSVMAQILLIVIPVVVVMSSEIISGIIIDTKSNFCNPPWPTPAVPEPWKKNYPKQNCHLLMVAEEWPRKNNWCHNFLLLLLICLAYFLWVHGVLYKRWINVYDVIQRWCNVSTIWML